MVRQQSEFINRGWWGTRIGPVRVRLGRDWQNVKVGSMRLTHRKSGWYFWIGGTRYLPRPTWRIPR